MTSTGKPTNDEVLKELESVTSSKTFEKHSTLADFLRFLVTSELKGESPTEHQLGVHVFGLPEEWRTDQQAIVRENTRRLKAFLKAYYAQEGEADPVKIELNVRGRRPRFSCHPDKHVSEELRRIMEEWNRSFPKMLPRFSHAVVMELEELVKKCPHYAPVFGALAETLLTYTMCDDQRNFPARQSICQAEEAISKCIALNDKNWKYHVIAGAIHCCGFDWPKAEQSFQRAMELDSEQTQYHFWYRCYSLAIGKTSKLTTGHDLLDIGEKVRKAAPINGLFRYLLREFNQAHWNLAYDGMSWDHIPDISLYYYQRAIPIADSWLVDILMAAICWDFGGVVTEFAERGCWSSQVKAFFGIVVLCHFRFTREKNNQEYAIAWVKEMETRSEMQGSVSMALSYMALRNMDEAVVQLCEACEQRNPLMVFLHLWPILDPLRDHPGFKALIASMQLPSGVEEWADELRRKSIEREAEDERMRKKRRLEEFGDE